MRSLETVFIANVILYIESIETVIKLIQVNKKCQEATKIIRYYNPKTLFENGCDDILVNDKVLDLFPNVETIRCDYVYIKNNLELFEKVIQIEMVVFEIFTDKMKLPQQIKNKIIKLDIIESPLRIIQLNEFPNVKKVKVDILENENLIEFLGDRNIKLKQLITQTDVYNELNWLKKYQNIENQIIKIKSQITKERYHELKQFANVYSICPIDGIDLEESFCLIDKILLSNEFDIDRLYELTLFTKCHVINDCDLRNFQFLEKIVKSHKENSKPTIQIKGLSHLKRLKYVKNVDCIPTSVTSLSFDSSFNYKELLEKDIDCFKNIKKVKVRIEDDEAFNDFKVFTNFKNCTCIELVSSNDTDDKFELPESVKELSMDSYNYPKQMKEISKLTGLKKLSITFNSDEFNEQIQEMYDKLKELEWLKVNCIDDLTLPSSLTYLELEFGNNHANLSQYTNLKKIRISFFPDDEEYINVKLPKKLNELCVCGSIIVTNSKAIEVEKIKFINTPSQSRKWNSKNIFIVEECEYFRNKKDFNIGI